MAQRSWQKPTICSRCGDTYTPRWEKEQHCPRGRSTQYSRASYRREAAARLAAARRDAKLFASAVNRRIRTMQDGARVRELSWELTRKEVLSFWQKPCTYCGKAIATVGLDRIDSRLGYCFSNVTPCCAWCNRMKSNRTLTAFIQHCRDVVSHIEQHPVSFGVEAAANT